MTPRAANVDPREVRLGSALQHQVLADETVEHRQTDGGQRRDQEHDGKVGGGSRHTAIGRDFERMTPLVQVTNQHEQRTGGDAVVQHLVYRAVQALLGERKDAENDKSQMADGGVSYQLLHIGLHHCDQRAVDDADDGKRRRSTGRRFARRVRKQRQAESDQSVSTHFQHDGRQHDGAGGGRFHVRIGKPGVQRKQRHLDGERQEKCQEQQHRRSGIQTRRPVWSILRIAT